MKTQTIKPASPLPWKWDQTNGMTDPEGRGVYLRDDRNYQYTVHACNNYPALVEALEQLFEQCAMVHKRWGEGCNQKESDAAIESARAALAAAKGTA